MVQLILVLVLVLGGVLQVEATTYYVATNGSDSANGTSEDTPFLTVGKCVPLMVAGDTCYVKNGTYNQTGQVAFRKSGTSTAPITLAAFPGHAPVIHFVNGLDQIPIEDFPNVGSNTDRFIIYSELGALGAPYAIGWIVIDGLEIENSINCVRMSNGHDITFRNNHMHHCGQGILGNGTRITVEKNIIEHIGSFDVCDAEPGTWKCQGDHGIYANGSRWTIRKNLFYDNLTHGIQQNGSSSAAYSSSKHPSTEYADAVDWIVESNTFAYQHYGNGIVVWGSRCSRLRVENNIFYENGQLNSSRVVGVGWSGSGAADNVGITIRNNHCYGSGSGATDCIATTFAPSDLVTSGNVINVSPPAFVNGGSNSLPVSPDFRLTASAPVNIALANEFPNNGVVGAYKSIPAPTAVLTANVATLTFPSAVAGPISNLSTAGVSLDCPVEVCPGTPTISTVAKRTGTDWQVDVTISGITSNACIDDPEPATISYNASTGSWTGNDNIGPYPGLHQQIFSFTNLTLDNQCTGSGTPSEPGTPLIKYLFDEGTGTAVGNSGSSGATDDTTLENGATWADGGGVQLTQQSTQHVPVTYGSGFNPTSSNLTVAFTVVVTAGQESLTRSYFGAPLGTNQRLHIATRSGAWGLGVQTSSLSGASNLTVDTGSQHLCMTINAATDTVTLHKNGQAGSSPHAVKTASSSYTLAGDFDLGRIADLSADGGGGIFRHFVLYESVEDCGEIYAATQVTPPAQTGTLAQPAYQVQAVYLSEVGGSPTNLVALSTAKDVVQGGGAAIVAKVHCTDVADCDGTAFRWAYRRDGAGNWQSVPGTENSDQVWHWGANSDPFLNDGTIAASIVPADTCTVTTGVTLLTADQIPSVDLPQDGCIMLRGIFRIGSTASGYYDFRIEKQGGEAFTGSYENARLNVIEPQASGGF